MRNIKELAQKAQKENLKGNIITVRHHIKLKDEWITNKRQYTVPISIRYSVKKIPNDLEKDGTIVKSEDRQASLAFIMEKRNRDRRLVVDYRD